MKKVPLPLLGEPVYKVFKKYCVTESAQFKPISVVCSLFGYSLYKGIKPLYDDGWILYNPAFFDYIDDIVRIKYTYFLDYSPCHVIDYEHDKTAPSRQHVISVLKEQCGLTDEQLKEIIPMVSIYSLTDDGYIGDPMAMWRLIKHGITEITKTDPSCTVCSIGFNPDKQTWYGWSHRAFCGFTIGSKVSKGDNAFIPSNKDEMLEDIRAWYVNDAISVQEVETGYNVTCRRGDLSSTTLYEFPSVWGRGEWVAKTIDDAKQMAIDFANGVS
jgi:hypothetical protein